MSRSQQSQVYNTATTNSGADQTSATASKAAEDQDISGYEGQLAKYAANNPYTTGGEFQTDQDKIASANADVGSKAIENQVLTQAQRTGENATAATATAAEVARQNLRDQSTQEATADASRVGSEADYNKGVVAASEVPAQLEAGEYSTSLGAANGALNTGESAAQTPSFWDELGNGFATQLGKTAAGGNIKV